MARAQAEGVLVAGVGPRYEDLDWNELAFGRDHFDQVMAIDRAAWRQELAMHDELFRQLAWHLPTQLAEVKDDLPEMVRQAKLKEQYDAYVADLRKKAHIEYR